jgi:pimeloyl-ACP methyl ester carboxylesterase
MARSHLLLVHGAWGGTWCWRDLGAELDRRGVPWGALDLPSSHDPSGAADLADDAAAVVAAGADLGPLTLVAHSYGGAVAAEAASRLPRLEGIVYLAALVPATGESATDVSRLVDLRTRLDEAIRRDGGILTLDPALAGDALYGGCDAATRDWAVSQLGSQTLASFRRRRESPDVAVATRYVRCSLDRAIDPSLQDLMAARCDEVVELASDHSPYFSIPAACADAVLGAREERL